jgi:tripartite-type tricarboxylate transporter receptor subunit TctC
MGQRSYLTWIGVLSTVAFLTIGLVIRECRAAGEKYPNKTIQVVICYQPGATDMAFRPFTEKLPEYLGQPIAFAFKPGAAGGAGASFVARAKPDGYTLIGTSNSPVITAPLTKELDYTLYDFAPICRLVSSPIVMAVKSDSPWKNLKEVVEEAKKSPGKLTYSTAGVFGTTHVPMELFVKSAGINLTHVPCEGSTPGVTALLGGHVSMTCSTMPTILPHFKSGALRPIAFFEKDRLKEFPDVPTFTELGYPVVYFLWYGLMAPKGTSEEVIKTISGACKKLIQEQPKHIEDRLEKLSLKLVFLNPEEFAKETKDEYEYMKKIIEELKKPKQ